MGSMGCEKSVLCLRVGSIDDRDRFAFADQLLLAHSRESAQSFNRERVVADKQLQYQKMVMSASISEQDELNDESDFSR